MGAGAALRLDVEFTDLGSVMGRSSGPDAASNATQEHSRARVSFTLGFWATSHPAPGTGRPAVLQWRDLRCAAPRLWLRRTPTRCRHRRGVLPDRRAIDRKSTRLNSSHLGISYAVFCLKKKHT